MIQYILKLKKQKRYYSGNIINDYFTTRKTRAKIFNSLEEIENELKCTPENTLKIEALRYLTLTILIQYEITV